MTLAGIVLNCLELPKSALLVRDFESELEDWKKVKALYLQRARAGLLTRYDLVKGLNECERALRLLPHLIHLKRALKYDVMRSFLRRRAGSWDYGVDFGLLKDIFEGDLRLLFRFPRCFTERRLKHYFHHLGVSIIALLNGARLSEAYDAFRVALQERKGRKSNLRVEVRVRKKKREEYRVIYVPSIVLEGMSFLRLRRDDAVLRLVPASVRMFLRHFYGINPHTLRYAFITELVRRNVGVPIIARITHHSKIEHILTYTSAKQGEEVLKDFIEGVA